MAVIADSSWRVLIFDLFTRRAQAELRPDSLHYGEILNRPGSFRTVIPLLHNDAGLTPEMLRPPRAVLGIEKDGVMLHAGTIETHSYDINNNALELAGEGYQARLRRRLLRLTKQYSAAVHDQADIVADLIAYTQSLPNGDLGIDTSLIVPTGRRRTRTYWDYERKVIGTLIEQLADVQDGFDFRLTPRWTDGPNSQLTMVFELQYPATGRQTDLAYDLGANGIAIETVTLDGTNLAFTVDALGQGEGDDMRISTQADDDLIAAHGQLDDTVSATDVSVLDTLTGKARRRLARGRVPVVFPKVVLDTTHLGTLVVGDRVKVRADYGLLQLDQAYRITQHDVALPAIGPEKVTLTLAPVELFE